MRRAGLDLGVILWREQQSLGKGKGVVKCFPLGDVFSYTFRAGIAIS
jgi:hypothetical protein